MISTVFGENKNICVDTRELVSIKVCHVSKAITTNKQTNIDNCALMRPNLLLNDLKPLEYNDAITFWIVTLLSDTTVCKD